jgi:hypothetical protein
MFWKLGIKSTVPEDTQAAEKELDKLDATTQKSGKSMQNLSAKCTAAGAVMTGLGASIVLLTDSAKKTNAELAVTALQLGVSTEEMRDLALATTNVTFPLEEVTASFDLLTRAGETDTEVISGVATAYDTLGDATGNTASKVTETMVTALKTFDISAEESTQSIDGITYMLRNSIVEMENLDSVLGYITPDVVDLGFTLDDTTAALGVMADKGMSGAVVTREFRSAITEATADTTDYESELTDLGSTLDSLVEKQRDLSDSTRDNSLSLRSSEINIANAKDALAEMRAGGKLDGETTAQYNRRIEEQEIRIESLVNRQTDLKEKQAELKTSTEENTQAQIDNAKETAIAEAASVDQTAALDGFYESLGITKEEVDAYKEKMAEAGGITQEYADAANTQYGAVDGLKQKFSEFTLAAGSALEPLDGVGVAMTTFGGIMMGVGPMMTIFSGINLGTMVPSLMATATASWAVIAPWAPLIIAVGLVVAALWILEEKFGLVTWAIDGLWSIGETLIGWITGAFSGGLDDGGESLLLFLGPIGWIIEAFLHWDEILPIITGVFTDVIDYIEGLFSWFGEAGGKIIEMLVDGILNSPLTPFGAISSMLGLVGDLLPHSPAKTGPLSVAPNWGAYLVDPLLSVEPAMQSAAVAAVSPVSAVTPGATSQTGGQTTDNSMSINQITFNKDADIAEFWRQRDSQITRNRVQRGIRI